MIDSFGARNVQINLYNDFLISFLYNNKPIIIILQAIIANSLLSKTSDI